MNQESQKPVGNAAACIEALTEILEKIDTWRTDGVMEHWQYSQLFDIANAALAAPARQCDVGTAEEQYSRFDGYCECWQESGPIGGCSSSCPCLDSKYKECDGYVGRSGCFAFWAQMPYAEKGAGK